MKIEVADYDGKGKPELFLDWLRSVDKFFEWKNS